jgi:hypothetical protein
VSNAAERYRFSGRTFRAEDIALMREVVATCAGLSRKELANTISELVGSHRGRLHSCGAVRVGRGPGLLSRGPDAPRSLGPAAPAGDPPGQGECGRREDAAECHAPRDGTCRPAARRRLRGPSAQQRAAKTVHAKKPHPEQEARRSGGSGTGDQEARRSESRKFTSVGNRCPANRHALHRAKTRRARRVFFPWSCGSNLLGRGLDARSVAGGVHRNG